jgi:cytochrome P450
MANTEMIADTVEDISRLPLPPGRYGLPLVGETLTLLRDNDFSLKRFRQYGPIYRTHLLGRPTIVMSGAEANEFLLSSGMDHFSWEAGWPNTFKELLGRSLFLQDGEEHRHNRKLIAPAFHGRALAAYLSTIDGIARGYLQSWQKLETFAWFTEFKKMTFDIACTLLIGAPPGPETAQLSQHFTDLTNGLLTLPVRLPGTPFYKAIKARDAILQFVGQQIEIRRADPTQDALSMLVHSQDEDGRAFSNDELAAQAVLLLFAGHETTTSMLASFCLLLAQHPAVWEKLRAEQANIPLSDPPVLADFRQMPYLEKVLLETERIYPPVAGGFRGVTKAFSFAGYQIPQGFQIQYNILNTHYDTAVFPEPEKFDPERFSEENRTGRSHFSLVGFGGGPRTCIGKSFALLEIRLLAARLLREYAWEILPEQDTTIIRVPTARPKDNLLVRFWRR